MQSSILLAPRTRLPYQSKPVARVKRAPGYRRHLQLRVRAESPLIEEVAGRRINAPVFNRARWSYHQDTGRYARHLQSIFRSVTFRNLQAPLSWLTLVSCCVVLYRTLVDLEQLPDVFEGVRFTDVPFQLTSFALSLLLVFRTDASYSRWCSALDAWGTLRNSASQLVRKATACVSDQSALERLVRWVGAFPLCVMVELRHDPGDAATEAAVREQLCHVLRPHEVDQVAASGPYYHQFCLSVLTALVEAAGVGESREATMLEDLNDFNRAACECEKISRFPIPLTYTRHTSRFMLIYLAALPLALYDSCDWAVIPVTLVIAFLLLGIEDIGVQIEEPFSILPLPEICEDLCTTAHRAIAQRNMVRCLADPDTCAFDPEELLLRGANGTLVRTGTIAAVPSEMARFVDEESGLLSGEEELEVRVGVLAAVEGGGNGVGGAGLSSKPAAPGVAGSAVGVGGVAGRGSYIYSKGAGLVAAVAESGSNGHGHGGGYANGN